ncbi:MAG: transposase [Campylobacterales bacterium]|nr:transposase [Campylobacterales bacterium]
MWVSIKEAAAHFGVGERGIRMACERKSQKYRFQKVKGIGGRGEVYEIWIGEEDEQTRKHELGADQREAGQRADPREALKLTAEEREKAELRCRLVVAYEKRPKGMTINDFMATLSVEYEALHVTTAKINRWLAAYRKAITCKRNVIVALADSRGRPKGSVSMSEAMKEMTVRYLLRRDVHLGVSGIYANLRHAFGDALPSVTTIERFIAQWKEENALVWQMRLNPDRAKSHYMPAFGDMSEKAKWKNHVWELDGTVADVVTSDGRRWLIVGAIDVFSRRVVMSLEESNTSYALARNMRKAIIKLGVPDQVVTDNGKDYTSNHFASVCFSLGIEQVVVPPFSGDRKPHIERFFGTMARELFREIEGFCGHSVAERQAIQAGLSFEHKLQAIERWKAKSYSEDAFAKLFAKKKDYAGLSIEVPLSPEELSGWIDRWVDALYEQRKHGSLGVSPEAKWQSDFTPAKTVGDHRALDFLLGQTVVRTVGKKGITVRKDGVEAHYSAVELFAMVGEKVVTIEPDELGELLVYTTDHRFVCVAEDPALKGQSREKHASAAKEFKKKARAIDRLVREQEALAKTMADPLISDRIVEAEARLGIAAPEIRTLKETIAVSAAHEALKSRHEEPKTNATRRWESVFDRFVEKMLTKTWDEKDTVLSEKYPDMYELALKEVERRKRAS